MRLLNAFQIFRLTLLIKRKCHEILTLILKQSLAHFKTPFSVIFKEW